MGNPTKSLLRQLPSSLTDSADALKKDANAFRRSIQEANARVSEIPKENVMDEIMLRLEADALGKGLNISSEYIDEIGIALIKSYGSISLTAIEVGISETLLKYYIRGLDELQVYYEIAHEGIKMLTDQRIIEGLKTNDPDIIKMVFQKMYAGRGKGGYNIAELGTMGYNDALGKKLAAETEADRSKNQTKVEFIFIDKPVRTDFQQVKAVDDENTVDGELVDETKSDS